MLQYDSTVQAEANAEAERDGDNYVDDYGPYGADDGDHLAYCLDGGR